MSDCPRCGEEVLISHNELGWYCDVCSLCWLDVKFNFEQMGVMAENKEEKVAQEPRLVPSWWWKDPKLP